MTSRMRFASHVVLAFVGTLALAVVIWQYQHKIDKAEPLWRADAPAWDHMPLRVYWNAPDYDPYTDYINASMGLWNSAVGCEVLSRTKNEADADVIIRPLGAVPCGTSYEGDKAPMWTCYHTAGAITETRALGGVGGELERFEHEEGHWLDLDHRRDGSIMEPLRNDPQLGDAPAAALISGYVADAVKARWCR